MAAFEFATAGRIIYGSGTISRLADLIPDEGRKVLIVHGYPDWESTIFTALPEQSVEDWTNFKAAGEPTLQSVRECAEIARQSGAELIIGIGGGSALDMAKAAAAMAANPGDVLEYLEVIGEGKELSEDPLPVIAIPTTAGTGSEVTSNAVIGSDEHLVKVSLRHRKMLPAVAIVDPSLTLTLPPDVTGYTGLDALVQVIEPLLSRLANPMTDALCREGIKRAGKSLLGAVQQGEVLSYREDMSLVSLFGGLALANSKLGAVHGIAGPFGGMYPAPHGAICGRLLAPVLRHNLQMLQHTDGSGDYLARFQEVAGLLTGNPQAEPEEAVAWVEQAIKATQIPGLTAYGFVREAMPELISKSQQASSMKGNPVNLSDETLEAILTEAM